MSSCCVCIIGMKVGPLHGTALGILFGTVLALGLSRIWDGAGASPWHSDLAWDNVVGIRKGSVVGLPVGSQVGADNNALAGVALNYVANFEFSSLGPSKR